MNQLQNQAKKCWLPWGQSPSPRLILQAALQTAVCSFSLHIHPVPVITEVPSLKSVFPAGKTLEERVGTQDLGEGWQLWCVTKQLAVLGAISSGDQHHTLRRMRIKKQNGTQLGYFFLFNSGSCRSHHFFVFFMRLQGIEIRHFKQNPRFSCRSARDLGAFGRRCWQNGAAGKGMGRQSSVLASLRPAARGLLKRAVLRPVDRVGIPSLFLLCTSMLLLAAGTGRCFQDIGWPGDTRKRELLVTEQRT